MTRRTSSISTTTFLPQPIAIARRRVPETTSGAQAPLDDERHDPEGDDAQAIDDGGGVQTKSGAAKAGRQGRKTKGQIGDDEGDGEKLAAFCWCREARE